MPEAETPSAGLEDTGNLQEIHSFLEKYLETWLKALDHLNNAKYLLNPALDVLFPTPDKRALS